MDESVEDRNCGNDFLSQSYSQGIGRIVGTKRDNIFNFRIPRELLVDRKNSWGSLFQKYSEEVEDDVELDLNTSGCLQEVSKECLPTQRLPMRKSPDAVQYWVDTGHLPYTMMSDECDKSGTGSSLSEKELPSPHCTPQIDKTSYAQDNRNDCTSYSSVDTAMYIMSNTNVTKKADAMAIIEGAKYSEPKSPEDVVTENNDSSPVWKDVELKEYKETAKEKIVRDLKCFFNTSDSVDTGKRKSNTDKVDLQFKKCLGSEIHLSNQKQDSNKEMNIPSINAKHISTIPQYSTDMSKFTNITDKCNDLKNTMAAVAVRDDPCTLDKPVNISTRHLHRKKLYCGRDSPVDLIPTNNINSCKLSQEKEKLHPALDPPSHEEESRTFVKRYKQYLKRKRKRSTFNELIVGQLNSSGEFSDKDESVGNSENGTSPIPIQDSLSLSEVSLDANALEEQALMDISPTTCRNKNYSVIKLSADISPMTRKMEINTSSHIATNILPTTYDTSNNSEGNVAKHLVNNDNIQVADENATFEEVKKIDVNKIHPIVRLERMPTQYVQDIVLKKHAIVSDSNEELLQVSKLERSQSLKKHTDKNNSIGSKKAVFTCEVQRLDSVAMDSDQSTIIICECKDSATKRHSAASYCSLSVDSVDETFEIDGNKRNINPIVRLERLNLVDSITDCSTQEKSLPPSKVPNIIIHKTPAHTKEEILNGQYNVHPRKSIRQVVPKRITPTSDDSVISIQKKQNINTSSTSNKLSVERRATRRHIQLLLSDDEDDFSKFIRCSERTSRSIRSDNRNARKQNKSDTTSRGRNSNGTVNKTSRSVKVVVDDRSEDGKKVKLDKSMRLRRSIGSKIMKRNNSLNKSSLFYRKSIIPCFVKLYRLRNEVLKDILSNKRNVQSGTRKSLVDKSLTKESKSFIKSGETDSSKVVTRSSVNLNKQSLCFRTRLFHSDSESEMSTTSNKRLSHKRRSLNTVEKFNDSENVASLNKSNNFMKRVEDLGSSNYRINDLKVASKNSSKLMPLSTSYKLRNKSVTSSENKPKTLLRNKMNDSSEFIKDGVDIAYVNSDRISSRNEQPSSPVTTNNVSKTTVHLREKLPRKTNTPRRSKGNIAVQSHVNLSTAVKDRSSQVGQVKTLMFRTKTYYDSDSCDQNSVCS